MNHRMCVYVCKKLLNYSKYDLNIEIIKKNSNSKSAKRSDNGVYRDPPLKNYV